MKLIKRLAFGSAGLLMIVMVFATILEKAEGIPTALSPIYASPFFTMLWVVMAVCSAVYIIGRKLQRRFFTFLLHVSFLAILAGAFTTHVCGKQGSVHLRTDGSPMSAFVTTAGKLESFPFQVGLARFHIDYYKGSFAPMDFISQLQITDEGKTVEGKVSMNHIFSYRHYRFYQSSYDPDMEGTVLSVAYDPWGIGITYTGYALLLVSMLGFFFQKNTGFRALLRHPALRRSATVVCLLGLADMVSAGVPAHLSHKTASGIGNLYVYYHDRICPLQTLAKDFTLKIYGKPSYRGLTGEQVLTGWFFFYDDWKSEPVIYIKNGAVRKRLGINGVYASLNDFFGTEGYKLKVTGEETDVEYLRALNEANEKFNLISMVATGSMLKIFPCQTEDGKVSWFSPVDKLPLELVGDQRIFIRKSLGLIGEQVVKHDDTGICRLTEKIREYQQKTAGSVLPSAGQFAAEKLYNRFNYAKPLYMCCLTVGICSFVFYCRRFVRWDSDRKQGHCITVFLSVLLGCMFACLVALIGLRGYVSGHLPISNGYETMQVLAACAALLPLFFSRKFEFSLAFGFLICGFALLVSTLGESNPPITPLMPVLSSPLLSLHVMSVMLSYALLAFVMFDGVAALVLRYTGSAWQLPVERLYLISRILLYPAVFLLALGIFIGAVWANVSWGRYWGWDPKEVWALITLLIYASALHPASLSAFRHPMFFHWFSIFAFLSVLVTYFGVNFFLGGMHSYA